MVETRRTQASQQGEAEGSQFPSTGSATLQQEESPLPDPPLPSPPAPISRSFVSLSEEELDRRIAARQQQDRLEKKRTYLQALKRGEELSTELQRVMYAGSTLEGTIKRRWITYVMDTWQNRYDRIRWDEMEEFLKSNISDSPTRTFEAVTKLHHLEQKPDQKFNSFLDNYENIESELPKHLPEGYRMCSLLDKLRPELRKQIVSQGIPTTRTKLISATRRAETLIATQGRGIATGSVVVTNQLGNQGGRMSQTSETSSMSQANQTPSAQKATTVNAIPPSDQPAAKRGGTARPLLSEVQCYQCKKLGHYASSCPQTSDVNTTLLGLERMEHYNFVVIKSNRYEIVLGKPWHDDVKLQLRKASYAVKCTVVLVGTIPTPSDTQEDTSEEAGRMQLVILSEYDDYLNVFNTDLARILLPHTSLEHHIDLEEGQTPP
ncbi:hypothetical protein B7463_g11322, partial [Scytalidium lignicola]